ncbi:MAG TPA: DUF3426 domain-containing protein [Methylotenera sp.]|nr:DUF3426 domain-containing protein [Methylotenera sp.]HPH04705.1 DUF3426 domain-containing protein [Methylotenera sp.]HPN01121.1 DUF3426 domain-containing protein [Methylotenera sp.]
MSSVTTCPNCQSQFAVTDAQLSQYSGKVRCGHCLHVFDATQHIIDEDEAALVAHKAAPKPRKKTNASKAASENKKTASKSNIDATEEPESIIKSAEEIIEKTKGTEFEADEDEDFAIETIDYSAIGHSYEPIDEAMPSKSTPLAIETPSNIAYSLPKKRATKKAAAWPIWALILLLITAALGQTIYFMRDEIAIYYPSSKPYLEQACAQIGCSVKLPQKIDFIVIDDSEMQEDTERKGLIRLTSTLINQAGFAQAYPNLELTLTDADDKPKLRRTFKPAEYLTASADVESGLPAGAEIKINLAISAEGETLTGYRLFVTY